MHGTGTPVKKDRSLRRKNRKNLKREDLCQEVRLPVQESRTDALAVDSDFLRSDLLTVNRVRIKRTFNTMGNNHAFDWYA